MKQNNVFIDTFRIETQTVYSENGSINIYPCFFEDNPMMVVDGAFASQKGRMVTHNDGTSQFRPYAVDSGSRYTTLFRTPHGVVKETQDNIIFQLRFPKRAGKEYINAMLHLESKQMAEYVDACAAPKNKAW